MTTRRADDSERPHTHVAALAVLVAVLVGCGGPAATDDMAIDLYEPAQRARLDQAYADAIAAQRFADTYAATNRDEYWAEGAQDWFDTNATAVPTDGIHNEIHTRAQLETYDPALAELQAAVFGRRSWRYARP